MLRDDATVSTEASQAGADLLAGLRHDRVQLDRSPERIDASPLGAQPFPQVSPT